MSATVERHPLFDVAVGRWRDLAAIIRERGAYTDSGFCEATAERGERLLRDGPSDDIGAALVATLPRPFSLSLRDYLATHSTQPGISEIVATAGKVWRMNRVWDTEESGVPFDEWWESMPLADRLDLSARVRYAQADAMLKARGG